jgi:hypothetical protein
MMFDMAVRAEEFEVFRIIPNFLNPDAAPSTTTAVDVVEVQCGSASPIAAAKTASAELLL